jgi:hypothetical protein
MNDKTKNYRPGDPDFPRVHPAAFLLLDKAFPGGMEKVAATTVTDGGEAAGAKAKVKYTDHWLSAGDVALLDAQFGKVDDVLR